MYSIWFILALTSLKGYLQPSAESYRWDRFGKVVYDVTITTSLVIPEKEPKVTVLRVWHALPTRQTASSFSRSNWSSRNVSFEPPFGVVHDDGEKDSQHVFWQIREDLKPNTRYTFKSSFSIQSWPRSFDPSRCSAKWSEYPVYDNSTPPLIHAELAKIADGFRKQHAPAMAVQEFCKWIAATLMYDANVPYTTSDITAILRDRKGHCGHYFSLFLQLCNRAQIPVRVVRGMNLYAPMGKAGLHPIRADYENRHTWAEVYLPGSGWVEVDPGLGANAFRIPAQCIQNNRDFQNFVIWLVEDGRWKMHEWKREGDRWVSPYQLENVITYSIRSTDLLRQRRIKNEETSPKEVSPAKGSSPSESAWAAKRKSPT